LPRTVASSAKRHHNSYLTIYSSTTYKQSKARQKRQANRQ
jgi:hypothetical protein